MRFLLAIIVCLLASCRPEITCVDVGCEQGFACDDVSGNCVELTNDCRVVDNCLPNQICDANGTCRSAEVKCADGNPCPSGLVCDGQTGVCKPAFQCTVDGCSPAETCDSRTQRCVPKPCSADDECPDTHVCQDDVCRFGCRPGSDACPTGQSCLFQSGDSAGLCQPNCVRDVDCPFGQECVVAAGGSSCQAEPPCAQDDDCRPDEICTSATCVQPPCLSDADCLDSQICEVPLGRCLSVACEEDIYASGVPNHSRATAFALAPAAECPNVATPVCVYDELSLCPGSSDWFSVAALGNDVVRIRVDQTTTTPDVDLYVWATDGRLLAQNTLLDPVSTVRVAANRDQTLYIEIRPTTYVASVYTLSIAREFCGNDTFEENDNPVEATNVATSTAVPSELRAKTCGLDEDWFALRGLAKNQGLELERTVSDTSMVVQLLTPDGDVYDVPRAVRKSWLRLGTAGDYYIRAYSALGLSTDYRLSYTVLAPWACPGAQAGNTADSAIPAAQGPQIYSICPVGDAWDVVFYELTITTDGNLQTVIVPGLTAPDLAITLLRDDGTPAIVRSARWSNGRWELEAPVTAGRYLVRVTSSGAVGRLDAAPDFEMTWTVQP